MIPTKRMWVLYAAILFGVVLFDPATLQTGILLPIIFFWDFIRNLSLKIPIKEMILTTLSIQCLLIPFLYYRGVLITPDNYPMEVSETTYFNFLTPAFLMFAIGLSIFKEDPFIIKLQDKESMLRVGIQLLVIGFIGTAVALFAPANLTFFIVLISYVKYIGAIYILYAKPRNYMPLVIIAHADVLILSIFQSVFQNFLGWSMFFMLFYLHKKKISMARTTILISTLVLGVYILQQTKIAYRDTLINSDRSLTLNERFDVFFNQYFTSIESDETFSEENFNKNFVRFNQGYIISRIMRYVPEVEPYAQGETIRDAFFSALLPRFLNPNKLTVGGGNGLYTRFTGFDLFGGTSIDISIFGEIYANYGPTTGIFFALLVGLFYNLITSTLIRLARKDVQLIFWIPYLFFIIVRPENGFIPVFNHFAKATLVLMFLHFVYLKTYTIALSKKEESIPVEGSAG